MKKTISIVLIIASTLLLVACSLIQESDPISVLQENGYGVDQYNEAACESLETEIKVKYRDISGDVIAYAIALGENGELVYIVEFESRLDAGRYKDALLEETLADGETPRYEAVERLGKKVVYGSEDAVNLVK